MATIGFPRMVTWSALAQNGVSTTGKKPPNGCMNSLFFFDDWLLHAREGLDRKQGRPRRVKEIVIDSYPDPRVESTYSATAPNRLTAIQ